MMEKADYVMGDFKIQGDVLIHEVRYENEIAALVVVDLKTRAYDIKTNGPHEGGARLAYQKYINTLFNTTSPNGLDV